MGNGGRSLFSSLSKEKDGSDGVEAVPTHIAPLFSIRHWGGIYSRYRADPVRAVLKTGDRPGGWSAELSGQQGPQAPDLGWDGPENPLASRVGIGGTNQALNREGCTRDGGVGRQGGVGALLRKVTTGN